MPTTGFSSRRKFVFGSEKESVGAGPSGHAEFDEQFGRSAPRPRQVGGGGSFVSTVFGSDKESVGAGPSEHAEYDAQFGNAA